MPRTIVDADPVRRSARLGSIPVFAAAMHELSLIQAVVDAVEDFRCGAHVHVVRLAVGREACASQEALRFAFEACIVSTALEGAVLDIVETDGAALRLVELEVT